jgi:hypothetical protein
MNVKIESTTDSNEAVMAATGNLANKKVDDISASSKNEKTDLQDESFEDSETSKEISEDDEIGSSDSEDENEDEGLKDESKDEKKPKKKGGFQKRIEKFQKQLSAKEQEIEHWKREALKAESKKDDSETIKHVKESVNEPDPDDYENHKDYVKALAKWEIKQIDNEKAELAKQDQLKNDYQKQVQLFQEKISEFKKNVADFDEVIAEADTVELNFAVRDAILSSENSPQLMYELSKNVDELERINTLSPIAAAREIGKIEARLSKSSENENKKEVKITKTPPPVKPVSSGSGKFQKSPEDMDFNEYKQWRSQQRA